MGKKNSDGGSGSEDGSEIEAPPDLVDPITLTVMEDAVLAQCGHSFSRNTITTWLRQQRLGSQSCPVCKSPISEQGLIPNWALRNVIDRYNTRHGIVVPARGEENDSVHPTIHGESDDPPLKLTLAAVPPSAPPVHLERLASFASSASSASSRSFCSDEDTPPPATTTSYSGSPAAASSDLSPVATLGDEDDDGCDCEKACSCLCDRPTNDDGCCCWECRDCGVCKMANDCKGVSAFLFPTTAVTCMLSFGKCSNWYSRSICGSIYPAWVLLVIVLLCVDIVLICVVGTLWSLAYPLGLLFFLFTSYMCPGLNKCVSDTCGSTASVFLGNTF